MSHEIDESTGIAAVAIAHDGDTPWHGLGQRLEKGAGIAEWTVAAGLNWSVNESPAFYLVPETVSYAELKNHKVLIRDDTLAPLSVVSDRYKTVQPSEVLGFFDKLTSYAGFQMETAGALFSGKQIWAQARVGPNAKIMDDQVAPFLMLATSYDQSLPTIASFTSTRIVCNNTLRASLRSSGGENSVRVKHASEFDSAIVRERLSIAINSWEEFMLKAKKLAGKKITPTEYDLFLVKLLSPSYLDDADKIRKSKPYKAMLALFEGGQIGHEMDAINGTRWGAVNSVSQYVDYVTGRGQDTRLSSAWFGYGAELKDQAFSLLTA